MIIRIVQVAIDPPVMMNSHATRNTDSSNYPCEKC